MGGTKIWWPDGKERTEPPTGIMKPGGYLPQADKN